METNFDSAGMFSRRDFLKGSIVLAVGAAGAYALSGCAATTAGSATEPAASGTPSTSAAPSGGAVTLHRGYGAAHGEKGFTQVVVATADDGTILAANVDEYQFMPAASAGFTGVPNSDAGFAAGYAEGQILASKLDNNEAYSALMAEKAQSTQPWGTSMKAITDYCAGKQAADLAKAGLDTVSGATLVDAPNYLKLIGEVAKSDAISSMGTYTGDGSDMKLGRANAAAHGEKAFADAVSLVQGDVLVATSIDEFQFMDSATAGLVPVPNSDKGFGEGYAAGMVLMSKSVNSDLYSALMKEKAQATTPWIDSVEAIESFVAGKKISDAKVSGVDAVTGATLVDAAGYVDAAATAAKSA